ncbi:MAG: hypothetical protein WCK90_04580 [archaeon]
MKVRPYIPKDWSGGTISLQDKSIVPATYSDICVGDLFIFPVIRGRLELNVNRNTPGDTPHVGGLLRTNIVYSMVSDVIKEEGFKYRGSHFGRFILGDVKSTAPLKGAIIHHPKESEIELFLDARNEFEDFVKSAYPNSTYQSLFG